MVNAAAASHRNNDAKKEICGFGVFLLEELLSQSTRLEDNVSWKMRRCRMLICSAHNVLSSINHGKLFLDIFVPLPPYIMDHLFVDAP